MNKRVVLIILIVCVLFNSLASQGKETDDYWDQLHYALKYKIDKNWNEPPHKSSLEEYLHWINLKGQDLQEVKDAFQEVNELSFIYPENEVYKKWVNKFFYLTLLAEGSGNSTVNGATMYHMRDDCISYSPYIVGHTVRSIGRQIYLAATEAGFDPTYPQERSRCLINCSIGLLESDKYGFSLYVNRERVYGYFDEEGILNDDNLDFADISCVRRGRFSVNVEGEPDKVLTYAFTNASEIMNECDWWGFAGERQDAKDLLIEYYKDALCKKPPHRADMGHKFYRELAQEHNLQEAIDYNNGFYGVLYGKVEVEEGAVKKRAPGAKVVFQSIDEKWETTADENGEYRFEKVIMHKHCSPFHIWAEYKGDRVDDEFRGTLEEPNPNAIRLKNLLIKSTKDFVWSGSINIEITERFYCMEEEETSELSRREIRANDEVRTLANISVGLDDFDLAGQSTNAQSMLRYASGNLTLNMREDHWTKGYAEKTQCHNENSGKWEWQSPGNYSTRHNTKSAIAYRDIKTENLIMLIMKDVGMDKSTMEALQQQMQEAAQKMDLKAIESLKGQMVNLAKGENSNTFPVRIQVQLTFPGNITDLVSTTYASESYDVCNSDNNMSDSSSDAGQVNIVAPVTVIMEGTYFRDENGRDIIDANINLPEQTPGGFFSNICPDKTTTLKGNVRLIMNKE